MARTLKELAAEALQVQNAPNPMGVATSYAKSIVELRDRLREDGLPNDTNSLCRHPINRLWASAIHNLASMGLSDADRYSEADAECNRLAS